MTQNMTIRLAEEKDVPLILTFIKELADYENLMQEVVATAEILHKSLFEERKAEVIIGEVDGEPVSFALFFSNFSTFLGKPGLYLEDLYVREKWRGYGFGKQLLGFLADLVIQRDYGRLEWWCLDENLPSVEFYKKMGAAPMDEWTVFRVTGDELNKLAKEK